MEGTRWRAFHLDVAAGLLAAIIPAIRPVETLLLTTAEKRRLRRVVELMAEYGLRYDTSQRGGRYIRR